MFVFLHTEHTSINLTFLNANVKKMHGLNVNLSSNFKLHIFHINSFQNLMLTFKNVNITPSYIHFFYLFNR